MTTAEAERLGFRYLKRMTLVACVLIGLSIAQWATQWATGHQFPAPGSGSGVAPNMIVSVLFNITLILIGVYGLAMVVQYIRVALVVR